MPTQLPPWKPTAERLGLAFQITDDLLDVASEAQWASGSARTRTAGKLTFPGVLGIDESAPG